MNVWKLLVAALACVLLPLGYTGRCAAADNDKIVLEDNITYGKAGDTELKLDLARPQGAGPFPAIVFIHGPVFFTVPVPRCRRNRHSCHSKPASQSPRKTQDGAAGRSGCSSEPAAPALD